MKKLAISFVRVYQKAISPYLPSGCRYLPKCSEYCAEAIDQYGVLQGTWLTIRRLMRCHPLGRRGYDPVP